MNSLASQNSQSWLSWFLKGVLVITFLVLIAKLFEVQIIKGSYFLGLSEENRIRHIPLPAPRGKILARGGEVLAGNTEVQRRIKFAGNGAFEITDDLTGAAPEEMVKDFRRYYPLGANFAHASGYLGEIGPGQIGKIDPNCPEKGPRISGMFIGKTGLEEEYQCQLLGVDGEELIEVNTSGKKIRSLGRREPIPGQDVRTTIDYGLQVEVGGDMAGKKGAAIVTDVGGEILAFVSVPSFDPNLLVNKSESGNKIISGLFQSPELPFFNRVISGTFHPGSVFKPVVAVAALEEKVIDGNFRFNDPGIITVSKFSNSYSYRNWYFSEFGRTEGVIGLTRAIARSTDTFFYKIGEMAGPNAIASWAKKFGLDKPTGIDIPGETKGLIPTPDWKKQTFGETWFLGDTYHMAIGQGYVALTPVELNTYIEAVASGGKICSPHFLMGAKGSCRNLGISQKNLDLIKEGMKEACESGGTAYTFFDFSSKHAGFDIACKTGTAEVETDGTPHAWFTFFGPTGSPKVVATILIERGGQGSSIAGPIARKIADYYLLQNIAKQ